MPNDSQRLIAPRFSVTLDDDSQWIVHSQNADLVNWDRTRARMKWPVIQDAPFLWMTFMAWSASKRHGDTTMEYAEFETRTKYVENLDTANVTSEEIAEAFPTLSVPGSV